MRHLTPCHDGRALCGTDHDDWTHPNRMMSPAVPAPVSICSVLWADSESPQPVQVAEDTSAVCASCVALLLDAITRTMRPA
jgi:hypothetical protein